MYALEDEVAVAVDRNNLLRVANRAKRLDGSRQLNLPLAEIVFPDAFTKTATGLRFLLYDSRLHELGESVIFIFASPQGLAQLRLRDHWSADGTFWCTPRLFNSLYTVHANIGASTVPAAYMLLQDRHETTYTRALQALVRYGNLQGVAPTTFMHGTLCISYFYVLSFPLQTLNWRQSRQLRRSSRTASSVSACFISPRPCGAKFKNLACRLSTRRLRGLGFSFAASAPLRLCQWRTLRRLWTKSCKS